MLKYVKIKNHIFNHANYHVISYLQGNFSCELTENYFMNVNVRQRKSFRFIFTIYDLQQLLKRLEDLEKHTKVKVFQYEKATLNRRSPMLLKDRLFIKFFPLKFATFQKSYSTEQRLTNFSEQFRKVAFGVIQFLTNNFFIWSFSGKINVTTTKDTLLHQN